MRHIAVVGMSFCGSTALSHVLGALPGVGNVGEVNWVTAPNFGTRDFSCNHCGVNCAMYTPDFLAGLRADQSNWYPRLAQQHGRDVLVSSDKDMDMLKKYDPSLTFDAICCFRPPLQAHRSYNKKPRPGHLEFDRYLWYWTSYYAMLRYTYPINGRKIWVDFSAFTKNPEQALQGLCATLGLTYDKSALEYWKVAQHSVGGNRNLYDIYRSGGEERVRIAARPFEPTDEELAVYEAHATARSTYEAMQRWTTE